MSTALIASGLSVDLSAKRVVQPFDLRANAGTLTVFCGPNGAGKTTVLKALAGLLPYGGSLELFGRDARTASPRERARIVSYVPQHTSLQTGLCVREVVEQGRYAHGSWPRRASEPLAAVTRALEMCHVTELADRPWSKLSGGEQRRVLLSRALATEAPIILLDEPSSGLDVAHALRCVQLLRELVRAGLTLIVVLHDLEQVRSCADNVLLMAAGDVVESGPASSVLVPERMRAVYGVELLENAGLGYRLCEPAS